MARGPRRPGSQRPTTTSSMVDSRCGPVPYNNMAVLLRPVTSADDPVLDRVADFYADGRRDPCQLRRRRLSVVAARARRSTTARSTARRRVTTMFVSRARPGAGGRGARRVVRDDGARSPPPTVRRTCRDARRLPDRRGSRPPTPGARSRTRSLAHRSRHRSASALRSSVERRRYGGGRARRRHGVVNLVLRCHPRRRPATRACWSALVWARVNQAPDQPRSRSPATTRARVRAHGLPAR